MEDLPTVIGDWKVLKTLRVGGFSSIKSWQNQTTQETMVTKMWTTNCDYGISEGKAEIDFHKNYKNVNIMSARELPKVFEAGLIPIKLHLFSLHQRVLPVLCMEYYSTDVRHIMLDCENSCGLQEREVREILQDVKNAVQFLYQNKITHNNLSPENIVRQYVKPNSNPLFKERTHIYKIIDASKDGTDCTDYDIEYNAPENFILDEAISSDVADFWSFGLIAFEIICGVKPFLPLLRVSESMKWTRMKSNNNICIYQNYFGDLEYSPEIFPENHISKHFKTLIENWLRTALEWQPNLRGRMSPILALEDTNSYPTENLTIFTLFDEMMNTSAVKIFSVYTLDYLSYDFTDLTTIGLLKSRIKESTQIQEQDQLLISIKTNSEVENQELLVGHWENNSSTAFYLFNKAMFLKEEINYIIPKSVSRAIESKTHTYNYKNSFELYRCGCYFVHAQKDLCNEIFKSIEARVENFHEEIKQLVFNQHSLSKIIGKVEATFETARYLFESGKQRLSGANLNNLTDTFIETFTEFVEIFENTSLIWKKFFKAWERLTIRLQSCARRGLEFSLQECHLLFEKYDFENIIIAANNAYLNYWKNLEKYKVTEMVLGGWIRGPCEEALKMKSKLLTELRCQPFILRMVDYGIEISKLKGTVQVASRASNALLSEVTHMTRAMSDIMWSTVFTLGSIELSRCGYNFQATNNLELNDGNYARALPESEGDATNSVSRDSNTLYTAAILNHKGMLKKISQDLKFLTNNI